MGNDRREEAWSPGRLLQVWGLRVSGKPFTKPWQAAVGGDVTTDDELQAVAYVENQPGFARAREALRWIHVEFHDTFEGFRMVLPGESILAALARLDWTIYLYQPDPISDLRKLPDRAYQAFLDQLIEQSRTNPFVPIREVAKPDAMEIGEAASAEIITDFSKRWEQAERAKEQRKRRKK